MLGPADLKRGVRVLLEGEPFAVVDVHVQTPSARGASSLTKVKLRNLRTGQLLDRTFRGGDRIEQPDLETRSVQYLYRDGAAYHFMDRESYDQFSLTEEEIGEAAGYLVEGLEGLRSLVLDGRVLSIELPTTVVLRVRETAPPMKGASAQAQTKPATLETGLQIQVPAYLEAGEAVQVDTREARFVARAKA